MLFICILCFFTCTQVKRTHKDIMCGNSKCQAIPVCLEGINLKQQKYNSSV